MNITLTPELKAIIERKVASGLYRSASEVVREALRLLEERERVKEDRLAALRAELQVGLDQLDRGEYVVMDDQMLEDVKARGRKRLEEAEARKKS